MHATLAIARWLLSLIIAVALGVAASGARAGTLSAVDGTFEASSMDVPAPIEGTFTHDFAFTLTQTFGISGSFTWLDAPSLGSTIGAFAASVRSANGLTVFASATEDTNNEGVKLGSLYIGSLAAGNYLLRVSGDASSTQGFYTGTLTALAPSSVSFTAAPVPEPGAWMMLAVGLGLIGATVGRRGARRAA